MATEKVMFKTEVKKVREIRNALTCSCRLNGTMVILSEENKQKLDRVNELLSQASNLLEDIK